MVEAGTGVGKSLAYLVPSILYALEQKKKAIISTHTINLQEQLIHKDIPILQKVLPVEFEAALMKGRQNFLCPRPIGTRAAGGEGTFHRPRTNELRADSGMGGDNARRIDERSDVRTRSESMGAGLQRGSHLHPQDLRPRQPMFLSIGPEKD